MNTTPYIYEAADDITHEKLYTIKGGEESYTIMHEERLYRWYVSTEDKSQAMMFARTIRHQSTKTVRNFALVIRHLSVWKVYVSKQLRNKE